MRQSDRIAQTVRAYFPIKAVKRTFPSRRPSFQPCLQPSGPATV